MLDSAYKLVEYDGRPVTKLSPGKGYPPGRTQAWRLPDASGVLTGRDEDGPPNGRPLLARVVRGGTPLVPASGIAEARRRCAAALAALPGSARRIHAPEAPVCEPSAQLRALHARTVAQLADDGRETAVTRREQEPGA